MSSEFWAIFDGFWVILSVFWMKMCELWSNLVNFRLFFGCMTIWRSMWITMWKSWRLKCWFLVCSTKFLIIFANVDNSERYGVFVRLNCLKFCIFAYFCDIWSDCWIEKVNIVNFSVSVRKNQLTPHVLKPYICWVLTTPLTKSLSSNDIATNHNFWHFRQGILPDFARLTNFWEFGVVVVASGPDEIVSLEVDKT